MENKKEFIKQIVQYQLDYSQYYRSVHQKKQIVIHHTVSNGNAKNVIASWGKTKERVGVAFVIDRDGIIHQAFSSRYWAHHLGLHERNNTLLNQQSVAIELCSWGYLTKKDDKYFNYVHHEVPSDEVITYIKKFRGSFYFQKYTDKQLAALKQLLDYLCDTYNIPNHYNADMWDLSKNALAGTPGIYSHVSYRTDKSDCHPQNELVEVLRGLE